MFKTVTVYIKIFKKPIKMFENIRILNVSCVKSTHVTVSTVWWIEVFLKNRTVMLNLKKDVSLACQRLGFQISAATNLSR